MSNSRERGFTLIEVMISGALMALILTAAYLCLDAATSTQKAVEPRVEALQTARVALGLMAADLRNACPLDKELDFLGMHRMLGEIQADNVDFATHNYTPRRAREGDFCQESFYLDRDAESGQVCLYRRRNPRLALEPFQGGSREELARGVQGLRFEYFDGMDWLDSWGDAEGKGKPQSSQRERTNLEGLPEAVRITLWLQDEARPRKAQPEPAAGSGQMADGKGAGARAEPPLMFQTVARLNLAARVREEPLSTPETQGTGSEQQGQNSANNGANQ